MRISRETIEHFERLCRENGIPLTVQRRAVLGALLDRGDHPTADQIFEDVQARLPGVSRATVYRVLETLVRVGVARRASHLGARARFDPNTGPHHHLVCLRCGKMVDLDHPSLDSLPLPDVRHAGFQITEYSIHFQGICSRCRSGRARRHGTGRGREKPTRRNARSQSVGGQ